MIPKIRVPKKKLQKYWDEFMKLEEEFEGKRFELEKRMSDETGIEDLEFFYCGGWVGIGNVDRTMKLVQFQ